ncbi:prolyl oligopeptidase family serine peptidase [Paludibaculum fermentans]|uniref:Prolyl oligopeptidase family serine peptidase n=1 Tax=Paludibaculum fermentans TaxID=1473598 RepID=A0A7S7NQE8_PALFE|nr:prolyl oligopeptidase family serine peptidase [Paludibaculum fermentans]QOY87886.1 prolyl oligopeptidase family serine peptidase [Paludibaculum fermentans]
MFRLLLILAAALQAEPVRPVPPPGVDVPAADRKDLEAGLQRLHSSLEKLKGNPLLPDVQIYHEAARYALQYNEFFKSEEIFKAKELLREGQVRADQLLKGEAPWTTATGLVVRGYVSKIDKSVQPYGLYIPPNGPRRWRLDAWFHGRSEVLSEVNFLWEREHSVGEFTPPDSIVLFLYGRYCNANKLAGEVDLFEALADVKRHYPIDDNRIVVRGFSMGGAAAWHIAAHHAGLWAAAAPGAGFSETPEFLKLTPEQIAATPEWEKALWHMYNATDYASNFYNLPVVAYNGDIDPQKQAADVMERELKLEGMQLSRVYGPNTGHRYHPDSKPQINAIVDANSTRDPYPSRIRFTTWTLSYNRMKWVVVEGLEKHWQRARVDAQQTETGVEAKTTGVVLLNFEFGPGGAKPDFRTVTVDGQKLTVNSPQTDRSWTVKLRKTAGRWTVAGGEEPGLHKVHGLQGPIDDAFLDSFVFVKPSGTPLSEKTGEWTASELSRAIREWRRQFRGDAQVLDDSAVTDDVIASSNLVLWGDPHSNRILARILDKLPVQWTAEAVVFQGRRYPAATHVPVLIFPNPLNPKKYVVLNSGVTFREFDNLNNARQVPKLPDWAILDTTQPPEEHTPGKVVTAGFFNENWGLTP